MTQKDLNRAVATATGESLREIRRRGFSLADPGDFEFDSEPCVSLPQIVDWDQLDAQRPALFP